jgi:hypothetical protein
MCTWRYLYKELVRIITKDIDLIYLRRRILWNNSIEGPEYCKKTNVKDTNTTRRTVKMEIWVSSCITDELFGELP